MQSGVSYGLAGMASFDGGWRGVVSYAAARHGKAGLASKGGLRTGKAQSGVDGQAWMGSVMRCNAGIGWLGAVRQAWLGQHRRVKASRGVKWLGLAGSENGRRKNDGVHMEKWEPDQG